MTPQVEIRPGTSDDIPAILELFDLAGDWLVSQGRTGQWGTGKQSQNQFRLAQAQRWCDNPGCLSVATLDKAIVGALVVGLAVDHIPAAIEPELYINNLISDRRLAGRGIGANLLDHARKLARENGINLLRLDCYRGDDLKLVQYYQSQGFHLAEEFTVNGWPGQIMQQRASCTPSNDGAPPGDQITRAPGEA